jgi:hypothetical protein
MKASGVYNVLFDSILNELYVQLGKESTRKVIGSIDSFDSTKFGNVLFVGSSDFVGIDYYETINDALDYINSLTGTSVPSNSNKWVIRLFQPVGGEFLENIIVPDFVSVIGDTPGVIIGGNDDSDDGIVVEVGAGCVLQNVSITPSQQDKKVGLVVRDATQVIGASKGPYNVDGLTFITNGVENNITTDITVTFTGNGLTAQQVCDAINAANTMGDGCIGAFTLDNDVRLFSTNTVLTDITIVRSTGTANSVLGFSTTVDTIKARTVVHTTYINDVTVSGNSNYTSINNNHGWLNGAAYLLDKAMFGTIINGIILTGGHLTEKVYGISIGMGGPLILASAFSGFGNGGSGVRITGAGVTAVFVMCASYLNSYDIYSVLESPSVILFNSTPFDKLDPAGFTSLENIGPMSGLTSIALPSTVSNYFNEPSSLDTAAKGFLEFNRTVHAGFSDMYLPTFSTAVLSEVNGNPVYVCASGVSTGEVRIPIKLPEAVYSKQLDVNTYSVNFGISIDTPGVADDAIVMNASIFYAQDGDSITTAFSALGGVLIDVSLDNSDTYYSKTYSFSSNADWPPPLSSITAIKVYRDGADPQDTYAGSVRIHSFEFRV